MFILTQLNINQRQRLWALMDTHTRQPLLYPLLYLIDHLALRSSATQSASLQETWRDFLLQFLFLEPQSIYCH